jgi:putative transposase
MRREGFDTVRGAIERLTRVMGLQWVICGKPVRAPLSDKAAPCPLDHLNRHFKAPRPSVLLVSDFTYAATLALASPIK